MEKKRNQTGRVLRIERSSMHDGDGLRSVVFLKGCPLSCLWCSTPESQHSGYEIGLRAGQCTGCGRCAAACPAGALRIEDGVPVRDVKQCLLCFACEKTCPNHAWQRYGMDMDADTLVKEIAKDEIFFFHSGGGVTFSGGEPLKQAGFVAEAMRECRASGIHTAMETSLFAGWEQVEAVLPHLDFLFADLKLMDGERHRAATGVDNRLILENIKRIDEAPYPLSIHVRIPVIPGVNDDLENLRRTVEFCDPLRRVEEIELLPYHRLGMETYRNLKLDYRLEGTVSPSPEEMRELEKEMNRVSGRVRVRVGG